MIRMNKNESPIKPLNDETLMNLIKNCDYHLYPDTDYDRFRQAYANYYGQQFSSQQLCCGNGSDELIQKLMLIMPEGPCLTLNPDFFMYQDYARQVKRQIRFVDASPDLTFSLETILDRIDEVQPRFFILSNPHNPTGHRFTENELITIANQMKVIGGYLIVDEAYVDFSIPLQIELEDHILIMRTLSKAFAMAGLRLGVLISTEKTISTVRQIEHPYPLSAFTLSIGIYLFEHMEQTKVFIQHQLQLSQRLKEILMKYASPHMHVFPSDTNFVLTSGPQALSLGHYVKARGFLPRFYHSKDEKMLAECVRYSIIDQPHLNQFEKVVKEWSEQQ
ncbi:pyridoxal phosphate-dependent aminotransferase [Staphylococcus coagulans]|uniref:pyridoxal phosphate-dependent aminotransferase n=1 Tax=Staphylococcus coagulans TaxID=74706 RepID=UPI002871FA13|nr:histidinol-phosphate transaminase [Staphylococcus coagulans]MDR9833391.1 histidinol-phosphate transaminase [Staphylococcus coagulans]